MKEEKENLTFRLINTEELVMLSFSDGNVISMDSDGLSTYNTNKTVHFNSKDVRVHSTYIESKDEDGVLVMIFPDTDVESLGLSNDTVLANRKKIRTYTILPEHYEAFKEFAWQDALKKFSGE